MEDSNILFEFHIKGSDYTKISEYLTRCSIKYTFGGVADRNLEKSYKNLSNKLCNIFKINLRSKNKESEVKLPKEKDIYDKIKKELIKKKSAEIKNTIRKIKIVDIEQRSRKKEFQKKLEKLLTDAIQSETKYNELKWWLLDLIQDEKKVDDLINLYGGRTWEDVIKDNFHNYPLFSLYKTFSEDIELIENEELIVGNRFNRDRKLEENDCKLYMSYKNSHMFGNLVGTVRKEYSVKEFVDIYRKSLGDDICNNLEKEVWLEKKVVVCVQISSRLDSDNNAPFFLIEMLTQGNIKFNSNYPVPNNDNEAEIFDCLLLWRLKQYLLQAYGKGIYRAYNTFRSNGRKLKGSIDFTSHIKLNMGINNGNIASVYKEKSSDNYLNHLILEAYEELKSRYFDLVVSNFDTKYETNEVIQVLKNKTGFPKYKRSFLMKKCSTPISHPFFTEYEKVRKVCLSILRGDRVSIISGVGDNVSGILYYITDLWEEYLESKMKELNVSIQEIIRVLCDGENYNNEFRPDYIFRTNNNNNKPFMILDAKYKPGWMAVHKKSILGNLKEDYVECIRNMNALNSYATGVIFPCTDSNKEKYDRKDLEINMHAVSEYNNISSFYSIPVYVPKVKKGDSLKQFEEWQDKMNEYINDQFEKLKNIIAIEEKKFIIIDDIINNKMEEIDNCYSKLGDNCNILRL